MKHIKTLNLLLLTLMIFLSACSATPTPTTNPTTPPTATELPTATSTFVPSPEPTATITPEPTATPMGGNNGLLLVNANCSMSSSKERICSFEVNTYDIKSHTLTLLSKSSDGYSDFMLSPDGNKIILRKENSREKVSDIYIADVTNLDQPKLLYEKAGITAGRGSVHFTEVGIAFVDDKRQVSLISSNENSSINVKQPPSQAEEIYVLSDGILYLEKSESNLLFKKILWNGSEKLIASLDTNAYTYRRLSNDYVFIVAQATIQSPNCAGCEWVTINTISGETKKIQLQQPNIDIDFSKAIFWTVSKSIWLFLEQKDGIETLIFYNTDDGKILFNQPPHQHDKTPTDTQADLYQINSVVVSPDNNWWFFKHNIRTEEYLEMTWYFFNPYTQELIEASGLSGKYNRKNMTTDEGINIWNSMWISIP